MIRAFDRALARGDEIARALRDRDAATLAEAVGEAGEALRGARLAAAGYGLDACVELGRGLR